MLIATAGHVDHGKTLLIKSLTGIDTDRLPDEKARGLTIDLGFAYQSAGHGRTLGFVDVPGHERFIRNMLAGVGAIDFALLIVAADDGPMPQTREHLAILDLMNISHGAVVITKIDRVPEAKITEVETDLHNLLAGTTLRKAPVFKVSAMENVGITDLREHLHETAANLPDRSIDGNFRLAVDRSFTVAGAGVVVTGAVFSGAVSIGDRLRVQPGGAAARIRSIHAQGAQSESGQTGHRCALNVAGADISAEAMHRGQWLVGEACGDASRRFDVRLKILSGETRAFAHWTPVHVHLGTASSTGRVALLSDRKVNPGDSGLAQLVVEKPMLAVHGDRFVLRDQSARRTIGGGQIIDPYPPAKRKGREQRVAVLKALELADAAQALQAALHLEGQGLDLQSFVRSRNATDDEATQIISQVPHRTVSHRGVSLAFADERWNQAKEAVLDALAAWHDAHSDELGPDLSRLRQGLPDGVSPILSDAALNDLLSENLVIREGTHLRLKSHEPRLPPNEERLLGKLRREIGPGDLQPPVVHALAQAMTMQKPALDAFLLRCVRRGQLIRVCDNRFLHPEAVSRLVKVVIKLSDDGSKRFTAREFRDESGIGRNFTIQLLEYLDAQGVTRRIGDERAVVMDRANAY